MNSNQQAAVDENGNTVVVAGPGSGKTRVIIAKIAKIYDADPSNRVCAATFSRDAADELTQRVRDSFTEKYDATYAEKIVKHSRINTFHSLAIQQMRDAELLGELATPQDQSGYINQAARSASTPEETITYEMAVTRIESAKCSLDRDPEAMNDPVVVHYQKQLLRNRVSDLYDVIRDAVLGMRDGRVKPMSVGHLACTHLLVDEFQDCDEVQFAWIMEHVRRGVVTMVVGDDDQTIYEWRRALGYQGILNFKEVAKAREVVLGENYRCREEILGYADNLIRHNKDSRIEKRLVANKGPGGLVEVFSRSSIQKQAEALVELLEPYFVPCTDDPRFQFTIPEGGAAIIARNHGTLHAAEAHLAAKGVKYQRSAGGFWKQPFLVIYLSLLKAIQLGRSSGIDMGLHFAGLSNESIERLHKEAGGKFIDFLEGRMEVISDIPKGDQDLLKRFSSLSAAWRNSLREGNYDLVIHAVASFLADEALYKVSDEDKREALEKAADILSSYSTWVIKSRNGDRPPTVAERVDIVLKPRKKDADGVALHTMHNCKGLEFDSVGVLHISEGLLPNPERPDDINDRRLLYVAMTRAKERLWISYKSGFCSRFIQETGILKAAA